MQGALQTQQTGGGRRNALAFLAMAFLVVGMTGIFASYAAPVPLERAMLREAALDDALRAAQAADPEAALAALRPRLGGSAAIVLPAGTPALPGLAERVATERTTMRARLQQEAAITAIRLRWVIGVVTAMAAVFGIAIANAGYRATPRPVGRDQPLSP